MTVAARQMESQPARRRPFWTSARRDGLTPNKHPVATQVAITHPVFSPLAPSTRLDGLGYRWLRLGGAY